MFSILKKIPLWAWLIFGFLLLNIATYDWYTSVWNDEGTYTDPSANLYFGHGFTSTAWAQSKEEYWVVNSPLYPFLLFVWFKLAGFGIFQVRVLGYLLWSGAVALICLTVQRARLVRSPAAVAGLATLLFSDYGLVFNYRSGRYDPLELLVLAACFLAFTIPKPGWRRTAIFLSAVLFLPTALTTGPFVAGFGALIFLVTGRRIFLELCSLAAGLATGFAALVAYLHWTGMWETYRRITVYYSQGFYQGYYRPDAPLWKQKLAAFPHKLLQDPTSAILLLILLAVYILSRKNLDATGRRLVFLGTATFFIVPALAQTTYTYQIYHCWETYIPLTVCLLSLLEQPGDILPARSRKLVFTLLALVFFGFGPGLRLGLESTDIAGRDYSKVEAFVGKTIHSTDVVMADFQAFYPLHKLKVTAYYYPPYLEIIKPREGDEITCLIINPRWLNAIRGKIGGSWVATGESYTQENKFNIAWLDRLFPGYYEHQSNHKYNLVVYRRASAPTK